ncbi:MAG: dihydroorotase [Candidatus Omnitrophota bacterium]|nr:MAG: dihydroorotase [Candidatus Omnitrophota bacterium]
MKVLMKNGTVVNADSVFDADVLLGNGKILQVGKHIAESADKVIDAKGKHLFPAFIDLHTHLRVPGREDEEDFVSGSKAAAAGGFTKIFCMPNTDPAIDNEAAAKWVVEEGKKVGLIDIYPVGAVTKAREAKELTEFSELRKAGCLCLSDDGTTISDTLLFRRALEYARMEGLLIISHCEDRSLCGEGAMREGVISSKYGVRAIPDIAESVIVARDIEIAKYLNSRIHLAHISTARSIEIIKRAKEEGVKVTAETAPHYFVLTVDDVEKSGFDSNFKVNPPLGEAKDVAAVKRALKTGVIDCIATDHAPHSKAEKEAPFQDAPFGFIGLETAFSLTYTYLVKEKVMDLKAITEKLSASAAKILGMQGCGSIEKDKQASIVIADLNKKWTVTKERLHSKSKNSPFLGCQLQGVIECTIHKGKIVYKVNKG